MNTKKICFSTIGLVGMLHSLSAATISFSASTGDWSEPTNWGGGALPVAGDTAVITKGRIAEVTTVITDFPNIIRVGNNANGGTLTVTSGSISANNLQAATASGSVGSIVVNGGSVTISSSTFLSSNGNVSQSDISFSGGSFAWGTNFQIGVDGTAAVNVNGDVATSISGTNLIAGSGATLSYNFDSSGVTALTASAAFTIDSLAQLSIDGAAYTGGAGTIALANYGSLSSGNQFQVGNVSIVGFSDFDAALSYGANSLDLVLTSTIPEPSTYAVIVGVLMLGICAYRRKRS